MSKCNSYLMGHDGDLRAVGAEIRRHRMMQGLSQEQLAERAGLHRNHVGFLERGERSASLRSLFAVARALHVAPAQLLVHVPETARRAPRTAVDGT